MRLSFYRYFSASLFSISLASTAFASLQPGPANSIPLAGGKALYIQGEVGTGSNTAFLALDFANNSPTGPSFAWEYHWSGTKFISDMLAAVAVADPSLTIVADPNYGISFVDNFNYGTNIGSANYNSETNQTGDIYWSSYFGPDNPVTQSVDWQYAPLGNTSVQLGYTYANYDYANPSYIGTAENNLIYGFTINNFLDFNPPSPLLPAVAVPEPASLGIGSIAMLCLLSRRKPSRT